MIKRKPEDYTSNFMTREHQPITDLNRLFKKYTYESVYLFYKGVHIGEGELTGVSRKKKYVHTDGVSLDRKYRKKGHGLFLYHHIISTAIRIGAKRIYSSTSLNKFSTRMWRDKLSKHYKVVPVLTRKPCSSCGNKHPRAEKFYIDL